MLRLAALLGTGLMIAAFWAWSALAIYFSNLPGSTLRALLAAIFALSVPAAFALLPNRRRTALFFAACVGAILLWWQTISPSHDREWTTDVAVLPHSTIEGDLVTVHDIRNFDYRSPNDFDVRYYDKTFDLRKIETFYVVFSYWDNLETVAHTMLSFGFRGNDYLTVSAETRRERGEPQTALRGLFKQYEMIFILGDERDLLRLRSGFRGEEVYLYPTTATPQEARALFLDILEHVNRIYRQPEFYNTLRDNCTTSLLPHIDRIRPVRATQLERIRNGFGDAVAYRNGWIVSDLPFPETKRRHHINPYVENLTDARDYSRRIRPHLAQTR